MADRKTAVIVEDEILIAHYLASLCAQMDVEVLGLAYDAEAARRVIQETGPGYVLMDVRLGGRRDGVDVAQEVHNRAPDTRVIIITGSNEPPMIERINNDHPFRILIKPILPAQLAEAFS